jgi:hypothetical protein
VTRVEPSGARLEIVAGNFQAAAAGSALADPLVVRVVDSIGAPLAGREVVFETVGNNGHLTGGGRSVAATTDAAGLASTDFVLGTRAGSGNQGVEATTAGVVGAARFHASALAGEPVDVVIESGDEQSGVAGQALVQPFIAVAVDGFFNRLPGVAVIFSVVRGGGRFDNGLDEIVVETDDQGRALATLTLGPGDGNAGNVVETRISGHPGGPFAAFTASGYTARESGETSVSGMVLDNADQPVPGATVGIAHTLLSTTTDADGLFRLDGVPPGTGLVVVDGTTTDRPGVWPHLAFEVTLIAGRENRMSRPLYLLPIDVDSGIAVDAETGGTLTLDAIPGLALEIAPGSVTFADGSHSGVVSITTVNSDKVPMVPSLGREPRLVLTIQPAGAKFDPPARLTLPNIEGLEPGQVTELFSFDHDLQQFLSVGTATVSVDGSVITTDPGVGILEAG